VQAKVWQIVVNLPTNFLCVLMVVWVHLHELLIEVEIVEMKSFSTVVLLALFVAVSAGPAMSADITQAELTE
jgi:hypothetical protein